MSNNSKKSFISVSLSEEIRPVVGNKLLAYCTFCRAELHVHLGGLSRHLKKKQEIGAEPFSSTHQHNIVLEQENGGKDMKREAKVASCLYCAVHGSLRG